MRSQPTGSRKGSWGWVWRIAWRDGRAGRKRLLLYVSSIVAGVAALVAIGSFGASLEAAIDEQAKTLLGADLEIYARAPFSAAAEEIVSSFGSFGAAEARQVSFGPSPFQDFNSPFSVETASRFGPRH